MASIHVRILEVSPLHEPTAHSFPLPLRWGEGGRRTGEGWFMVPMRAQKRKEAPHEPGRTYNAEDRMAARILAHFGVRCSMLDVGCSMFASVQAFNARKFFRKISPREEQRERGETDENGLLSPALSSSFGEERERVVDHNENQNPEPQKAQKPH